MLEAFNAEAYPLTTAAAINEWCAQKTEGMIETIIEDELDPNDRAMLVSAIYFKGNWTSKFDKSMTSSGQFNHMDGATSECQMMKQSFKSKDQTAKAVDADTYLGVLLPYGESKRFASLFVLPKAEGADALQACSEEVFCGSLKRVLDRFGHVNVNVSVPRFTAEFEMDLIPVFQDLGVGQVFNTNGETNFGRLIEDPSVFISAILHKAIVTVNEEGAEAAAVTAVVLTRECAVRPIPPLEIHLDRPFLFAVCDTQTGAILFSGKIAAPSFDIDPSIGDGNVGDSGGGILGAIRKAIFS